MLGNLFKKKKVESFDPTKCGGPKELANALKEWVNSPDSRPDIQKWYEDGAKVERKKTPEEIAFEKYSKLFTEAQKLKQEGKFDKASEIFSTIFTNYAPAGPGYYEEAAELYVRLNKFQEAIDSLNIALNNLERFRESARDSILSTFKLRIEDYEAKQRLYPELKKILKEKPGMVQKDLKRHFGDQDYQRAASILYYMENNKEITRIKKGNSYQLYLN